VGDATWHPSLLLLARQGRAPNTVQSHTRLTPALPFSRSSGGDPVAVHVLAYDVDAGIRCPGLPTVVDDDDDDYGAKTHSKVASEVCSTPAKPHRTTKPCVLRLPWPKCYSRPPRRWIHSETVSACRVVWPSLSLSLSLSYFSYCQHHAPVSWQSKSETRS